MYANKKREIKPVPIQPVIPPLKPEVTPPPEKPDKSIKPELIPETEPVQHLEKKVNRT
jgi:hypothetical protein